MARQIINIGSAPNDRTGDPIRTSFNKVNQNFEELYNKPDTSISAGSNITVTSSTPGQYTINSTNPFDQDLNTTDSVQFNSLLSPLVLTDNTPLNLRVQTNSLNSWLASYGDGLVSGESTDYTSSTIIDSQGNVIFLGGTYPAVGNSSIIVVKVSPTGQRVWEKTISNTNNYDLPAEAIAIDSNDNIYIAGGGPGGVNDARKSFIIKMNSSGSIVWQQTIDFHVDLPNQEFIQTIKVSSIGNIFCVAYTSNGHYLCKLDIDGNFIWSRRFDFASNINTYNISIDSAENIILTSDHRSNPAHTSIFKIDTNGTKLWETQLNFNVLTHISVLFDTDNNFYISTAQYLIKFNGTDGSIVWQRFIDTVVSVTSCSTISPDNSLYLAMHCRAGAGQESEIVIYKFDTLGNTIWQRKISTVADPVDMYFWYWSGVNNVYATNTHIALSGYYYPIDLEEVFIGYLLADGTGLGTHGEFVYGESTYTVSTPTLALVAPELETVLTVETPTISAATFSIADISRSFTLYEITTQFKNWALNTDGSLSAPNYTFPAIAGTTGQFLKYNGNGQIVWDTISFTNTIEYNPTTFNLHQPGINLSSTLVTTGSNIYTGTTNGHYNMFLGQNVGTRPSFAGVDNIVIGSLSLDSATSFVDSYDNVVVGKNSLKLGGGNNIVVGNNRLLYSEGYNNIVVGNGGSDANDFGSNNIIIGNKAAMENSSSQYNTIIGNEAQGGTLRSDANFNVVIGYRTNYQARFSTNNVYIGAYAAENNQSGDRNVAIGFEAASDAAADPIQMVAIGYRTLANVTGNFNTAIGCESMLSTTSGVQNTAVGRESLRSNTTGSLNVALGQSAGRRNTTGTENTFIGFSAGATITTGSSTGNYNTVVGSSSAGIITSGTENTFVGYKTGETLTTGNYNVFLGSTAGQYGANPLNNVLIGYQAGWNITDGADNVFVGYQAGWNSGGTNNIFIGRSAGLNVTNGNNNTIIGRLVASGPTADTVLIGAGTTERIRVDATGLYINGSAISTVAPLVSDATLAKSVLPTENGSYIRMTETGAKTLTFDSVNTFASPQEYHVANRSASGNITLVGTGITLNAPKGGTLVLEPGDTVTVKFISATVADVFGSTVAA